MQRLFNGRAQDQSFDVSEISELCLGIAEQSRIAAGAARRNQLARLRDALRRRQRGRIFALASRLFLRRDPGVDLLLDGARRQLRLDHSVRCGVWQRGGAQRIRKRQQRQHR